MPSVLKVHGDCRFKITVKGTETLSELDYNTLLTMNSKVVLYENVMKDEGRSSKIPGEKVPPYVQYELMQDATEEILKLVSDGNPLGDELVGGFRFETDTSFSETKRKSISCYESEKKCIWNKCPKQTFASLGQTNVVGQN